MPVPKRKTSKSRRDKRHSTRFIRPKALTKCQNCEAALSSHQACLECGFYKGKKVIRTKMERALSRGQARKAKQAKNEQQESQESQEGQK